MGVVGKTYTYKGQITVNNQTDNFGIINFHTNDKKIEMSFKPTVDSSKLKMDITVPYQLIGDARYSNVAKKNQMTFTILGMNCTLNVARNRFWNGAGVREFCERFDKNNKDGMALCKHEKLLALLKT